MPSPTTSDLPRPKSWDEFEGICADVLKKLWRDPYVNRNGRSGQSQHGVDCYGLPEHLGGSASGEYAGAQCKRTDVLTFDVVDEEVQKARGFKPDLVEYLLMTTAPRDAVVQSQVRCAQWPFRRVHLMFWEDICAELAEHDDLLHKHFPGWTKSRTSEDHVLELLRNSTPNDFRYDVSQGVHFFKSDVNLRIVLPDTEESDRGFHEPWVARFPNPDGIRQMVEVHYAQTRIRELSCVWVDGGRHILPFPRGPEDLVITPFQYHVGQILNSVIPGPGFDFALRRAGISVAEEDA